VRWRVVKNQSAMKTTFDRDSSIHAFLRSSEREARRQKESRSRVGPDRSVGALGAKPGKNLGEGGNDNQQGGIPHTSQHAGSSSEKRAPQLAVGKTIVSSKVRLCMTDPGAGRGRTKRRGGEQCRDEEKKRRWL